MKLHLGKHQKIRFRGRLLQDYTHARIELTVPVGSQAQTGHVSFSGPQNLHQLFSQDWPGCNTQDWAGSSSNERGQCLWRASPSMKLWLYPECNTVFLQSGSKQIIKKYFLFLVEKCCGKYWFSQVWESRHAHSHLWEGRESSRSISF